MADTPQEPATPQAAATPKDRLDSQANALGTTAAELDRTANDPLFEPVRGAASPTSERGRRLKVALGQIEQLAEEVRDVESRVAATARSLRGIDAASTAADLKAEAVDLKEAWKARKGEAKAAAATETPAE